ncbi:hypothetical protein KAT36_01705 [Candidatus Pacearchaeota archaeon]|nr:hypothetical protein [Candidatus Pacearchaeota archaeon]
MKKIFRKAVTVLGSTALIGATVGMAAAASYPEPFTSNTAIVVGANAAPSDNIAAASIASNLDASAVGVGVITVTDGDSYKFEKTSTKYHLGDAITTVVSSDLDEDQMPVLLNDGTFTDDDNDEFDYTQKINLSSGLTLSMFDDNDYRTDDPSIGFKINSGADVLTYTLEFSDEPLFTDLPTADMTIMGKTYYVLASTATKLTLLDSAADAIVAEGETATITAGGKTYTVSIEFVDSDSAKLNVNGEITNDIASTETYKLDDGSYLGMKEILYSAKDTGISKVEFSIGSGKLVLENGNEIKMNEDSIDGMTSTITNTTDATHLTSVIIDWAADDELFIAEDSVVTMPGFEAVSLVFGGLDYPAEEAIEVGYDGSDSAVLNNFPLKDSVEDINLLYSDGTSFTLLGKDSDERLVTHATNLTFDGDTDSYFVASWTDGRDAESYLMRATNFKVDNNVNKTTFQYRKDGSWTDAKVDRKDTDTFSVGNVELDIGYIDKLGKSVVVQNNSAQTSFNTLYSNEGMKVFLPVVSATETGNGYINSTDGTPSSWNLTMVEEDKDGDIAQGDTIYTTLGLNSQTPAEVTVTTITTSNADATSSEIGDTDVYRDFTYSALATEILFDQGGDQDFVTLVYHGDEVAADVYITSAEAVITTTDAGVMTVMDDAVSTVAGKNLIVVGGSAINSVAADLLGGAFSEGAFTSATGVGAGEFLIQSFDRAGKTALLVAGYNAADTEKAATYLLNYDVDTTIGNKYKGTSASEASLVVA